MPRLLIFLIPSGLSGLTGWATGWGLYKGYWLVTEVKFVTNQTNYITVLGHGLRDFIHAWLIKVQSSPGLTSEETRVHG